MDEENITRDKSGSSKPAEPEESAGKKTHGKKLKNETSQAEAMRGKIRFEKADTRELVIEIRKNNRLRKQGRKKSYSDLAVSSKIHNQVSRENEDNNAGVDAVNAGSQFAERSIYRSKMTNGKGREGGGYSIKIHTRKIPEEANPVTETEEAGSNVISRMIQKSRMKKEIQNNAMKEQARENANAAGSLSKRFVDKAEDMAGKLAEAVTEFLQQHPMAIVMAGCVMIVVMVISGALSSCSVMAGGGNDLIISTSYTAQDADIVAVENDYASLETDLQNAINSIEAYYPGYNEYTYSVSEISHDPFELAALLTVLYEDYTESEVQTMLQTIEYYQYTITITPRVETRTRTEERTGTRTIRHADGTTTTENYSYNVDVEYDYYILDTTLTNSGIQATVDALELTDEQLQRYAFLLETKGNKPDIFGGDPNANAGT